MVNYMDKKTFLTQPRWVPLAQYRTIPLPILPLPPLIKRIHFPRPATQVKNQELNTEPKV